MYHNIRVTDIVIVLEVGTATLFYSYNTECHVDTATT